MIRLPTHSPNARWLKRLRQKCCCSDQGCSNGPSGSHFWRVVLTIGLSLEQLLTTRVRTHEVARKLLVHIRTQFVPNNVVQKPASSHPREFHYLRKPLWFSNYMTKSTPRIRTQSQNRIFAQTNRQNPQISLIFCLSLPLPGSVSSLPARNKKTANEPNCELNLNIYNQQLKSCFEK